MEVNFHFIREKVAKKEKVGNASTNDQIANFVERAVAKRRLGVFIPAGDNKYRFTTFRGSVMRQKDFYVTYRILGTNL